MARSQVSLSFIYPARISCLDSELGIWKLAAQLPFGMFVDMITCIQGTFPNGGSHIRRISREIIGSCACATSLTRMSPTEVFVTTNYPPCGANEVLRMGCDNVVVISAYQFDRSILGAAQVERDDLVW